MTAFRNSITNAVIPQAESHEEIQAGLVRWQDVLNGPSYQIAPEGSRNTQLWGDAAQHADRSPDVATELVLGMHHPETAPRLDDWERGDTWGDRRLREIAESLKQRLRQEYNLASQPITYHVEKGGLFLKDAAVLSGIGIVGRSNLLLHPSWGPRIRLPAILLKAALQTTEVLKGLTPCEACEGFCQKACPAKAFPQGKYSRPICDKRIAADVENKTPDGEIRENGKCNSAINFCRACELSCPVGA
jgi:epoxyqueuosine reductase